MRRWLLPLVIAITLSSAGHAAAAFRDVPAGYWAASAIGASVRQGFLTGVSAHRFAPGAPLTRAELATALVGLAHLPAQRGPSFTDVSATSPFYQAVETATGVGLLSGVGGGRFDPAGSVTRAQAAVAAVRFLGLAPVAQDLADEPLPWTDAASIPSWARGAAYVTWRLGLLRGWGGAFHPGAVLSRAQGAVLLRGLETLPPASGRPLLESVARRVSAGAGTADLNVGQSTYLWALVHDAQGYALPLPVRWQSVGASVYGGDFTADAPGTYTVTASVYGTALTHSFTILVHRPATLEFAASDPQVFLTGRREEWTVEVTDPSGRRDPADQGRYLALTVSGPGGTTGWVVQDRRGRVSFPLQEAAPGQYTVQVSSPGLGQASRTFWVVAAPLGTLQWTGGTPTLQPGQTAQFVVATPHWGYAPVQVALRVYSSDPNVAAMPALAWPGTPFAVTGGPAAGSAVLTVSVAGGAWLPATFQVQEAARGALSLAAPTTVVAGAPLEVTVRGVGSAPVTLATQGPAGTRSEYSTVQAVQGEAHFSLVLTVAGSYRLSATAPGLAGALSTLRVAPASAATWRIWLAPSPFLAPGQTAAAHAAQIDAYGNPLPSGDAAVFTGTGAVSVAGSQVTGAAPGAFRVTANGGADALKLSGRVLGAPEQLLAGRGMWLTYGELSRDTPAGVVRGAEKLGLNYLVVRVAGERRGFYGGAALGRLVEDAHAAGIAVLGWVYPDLAHPRSQAAAAAAAAAFQTSDGERLDGMVLDLERGVTVDRLTTYLGRVRQAVGPGELVAAAVFPPQVFPDYPYSLVARYTQAGLPMDYWHSLEQSYSYQEAYDYVAASLRGIAAAAPGWPQSPVLQAFDFYGDGVSGAYSPAAREEAGALRAARELGAVGVSFFRWGSFTSAEARVIASGGTAAG
ncbi:MAG: S-layer homology domain-containing protein [Thermaerobacter sp.]|nr:S-layer homology domain-containing protein [Thermaerobacter sp.]